MFLKMTRLNPKNFRGWDPDEGSVSLEAGHWKFLVPCPTLLSIVICLHTIRLTSSSTCSAITGLDSMKTRTRNCNLWNHEPKQILLPLHCLCQTSGHITSLTNEATDTASFFRSFFFFLIVQQCFIMLPRF